MSRIRSIHPGIWTDEAFVSLSPIARLLFIGLWNECDDKGIFPWSPLKMKMRVLPADGCDAAELLHEIAVAGLVREYDFDGKSYGAVRNFAKFQRPKKPNDIHPATGEILTFTGMSGELIADKASAIPNHSPTASEKSPQREEGGGRMKEKEEPSGSSFSDAPARSKQKRKTKLPKNWKPAEFASGSKSRKITDAWPPGEAERQLEKFAAHHTAKGSSFDDWQAAWSTWVLNSEEFGKRYDRPSQSPRDTRDGFTRAIDDDLARARNARRTAEAAGQ